MKNKILLTLILGIFLISFASAEIQTFGTKKQNEDVNLIMICPDCTFNNVTYIALPDSTLIRFNRQMTKDVTFYNLTLTRGNFTEMGEYFINGVGDLAGTDAIWSYNLFITANGEPFQAFPNQFAVILFGFFLIIIGLIKTRYTLFKNMGSLILMIMGVLTLYPGYNFINHTTLFGLALGSILIGIGFWFLIEDSFSREKQADRFNQDQGEGEEELEGSDEGEGRG